MTEPVREPDCPICGKPADPRLRPFCSRRCSDVDLGRWLTGQYPVPAAAENDRTDVGEMEDGPA
jgi:endogenous inhibitor of DNA gyrase (YacG/DUF329 family)